MLGAGYTSEQKQESEKERTSCRNHAILHESSLASSAVRHLAPLSAARATHQCESDRIQQSRLLGTRNHSPPQTPSTDTDDDDDRRHRPSPNSRPTTSLGRTRRSAVFARIAHRQAAGAAERRIASCRCRPGHSARTRQRPTKRRRGDAVLQRERDTEANRDDLISLFLVPLRSLVRLRSTEPGRGPGPGPSAAQLPNRHVRGCLAY